LRSFTANKNHAPAEEAELRLVREPVAIAAAPETCSSAGCSRISVTCGDRWQRPGRTHPRTREARAWPLLPLCMVRRRTNRSKSGHSSDHRIGRTLGGRGPWRPSTIRRYRIGQRQSRTTSWLLAWCSPLGPCGPASRCCDVGMSSPSSGSREVPLRVIHIGVKGGEQLAATGAPEADTEALLPHQGDALHARGGGRATSLANLRRF
jgi:hypothetical protein